ARKQLEQVAGLTREEAKRNLIDQMVEEAKLESAKRIRVIEEEAKEEAVRKSQKIIALAIERLAGDFVAERSVTVFPLPNDELKGKIIGREGRNIRALEAATGIDLIVDDTPETVVISGHTRSAERSPGFHWKNSCPTDASTRAASKRWCASPSRKSKKRSARRARRRFSTSASPACIRKSSSFSAGSNIATATRRTCCCIRSKRRLSAAPWRPSWV